jgi:hypothetical protein
MTVLQDLPENPSSAPPAREASRAKKVRGSREHPGPKVRRAILATAVRWALRENRLSVLLALQAKTPSSTFPR